MTIKTNRTGFEIAVIGMAGAFPGAASIDEFWQNLVSGQDCIDVFTDDELLKAGVDPSLLENPNYVRAKGVFPDLDKFDADFFDYTPADVAMMDPQIRMLHQSVYHALEDAGYANDNGGKKRNIGLFAGASGNFTWELDTFLQATQSAAGQFAALQLNDKDFIATRLAYKLNLHGPAISVHTACSTSLLAIDMACRHIYTGACRMAVAGGVGLSLPSKNGYGYEDGMIKSADGKCRAFSDDANGTIEGNGMAAVVLKSLEDAEEDGDQIYAIIRGSAINNDGERKVGYTAPSVEGQVEVIRKALFLSEVEAESISYVEAHGTGTNLGDPVEIEALKQAFKSSKQQFCGIGSLKSNIGHMDTAAGIGSFVKAVLALQHQQIPPTINVSEPNKKIDFTNSPFYLVDKTTSWQRQAAPENPEDELPLRAGVSSFGIGGTNVHVILEEAPFKTSTPSQKPLHILSLAAADREGLSRIQEQLITFLEQHPDTNPADLCWTWHTGRGGLPVRQAIVFKQVAELTDALKDRQFDPELMAKDQLTQARTAFLFPGQGTQYPAMSQQLYQSLPDYTTELEGCLSICDAQGLTQARALLLNNASEDAKAQIAQTQMTQVCLFIVEYSLAKTLIKYGLKPGVMIGHSLGEFVAATLADVFTVEDAIAAVSLRGSLMQSMDAGAMLAVNCDEATLTPILNDSQLSGQVNLAAVNGPKQCTVAGTFDAIETLSQQLSEKDIKHKALNTSHAFHSFMMEPMLQEFGEFMTSLSLKPPTISYYSNVTGELITAEQATDSSYWQQHIRQAVRFNQGISEITADPSNLLIEVGPGSVLTTFAKQAAGKPVRTVATLASASSRVESDDLQVFAQALGDIQANGVNVDWKAWYRNGEYIGGESVKEQRKKIRLPLYPFAKREFSIGRGDIITLLSGIEFDDSDASGNTKAVGTSASSSHESTGPHSFSWHKALAPVQQYSEGVQPCLYFQSDNSKAPLIHAIGGLRVSKVMHAQNPGLSDLSLGNNTFRTDLDSPASIRRLLTMLRKLDDIPDLIVMLTDLNKTPSLLSMQQRASALCKVLSKDYSNQTFTLMMLIQSKSEMDEADEQQLAAWQYQLQAGLSKITVRLIYIPNDSKPALIQAFAKKLEREIFDEQAQNAIIRLTLRDRYAYELSADSQYQPGPVRFNQKHLALLVPQGYPVEALQQRLQQASGATITPIELSLNKPVMPAINRSLEHLTSGMQDTQLSWQQHYQLPDLTDAHRLVDEYCISRLSDFLTATLNLTTGDVISIDMLIKRLDLPEQLHRYADYFIHMLQEDDFLSLNSPDSNNTNTSDSSDSSPEPTYTLIKALDKVRSADVILKDIQKTTHLFDGQLALVRHTIDSFNKVLNNEIQPIEVLYPDGSHQLIQDTYTGSIQQIEDELIMSLFEDVFKRLVNGVSSIRILEVGGGWGMAMRRIMPMLAHVEEVEFWFTDVGSTFLADAKQFALEQGYDNMTFGLFDISKPAEEQGLPEGYFDLIYAYNVVHATKHIGQVTGNLEPLLNDQGIFCLLERTNTRHYVNLPWGMADGWWHFDQQERALSPLVSLPRWEEILRAVPFETVATYPTDTATQNSTDVGLIIAQAKAGPQRKINQAASNKSIWNHHQAASSDNNAMSNASFDGVLVLDTVLANGTDAFEHINGRVHPSWLAYENYYHQAGKWANAHTKHGAPAIAILSDGELADGTFHNDTRWQAANGFRSMISRLADGLSPGSHYILPFDDVFRAPEETESAYTVSRWQHLPSVNDLQHVLAAMDSGWVSACVHPSHCSMLIKPVKQDPTTSTADTEELSLAGGKSDYVALLVELMKALFGLDHISTEDDFFALGGDSLKVAQLTTELEKHGIKIMPNEVFNFPKVAHLASYLHQNYGATSRQVDTDEELIEHLQRQPGLHADIRHYNLTVQQDGDTETTTERSIRVLYLDDKDLTASNHQGQALVEEMLALDLDKALQPDYVFPASKMLSTDENSPLSQSDFDAHFATAELTQAKLQQLVQQVKTAQYRLSMSITNQPVEMEYAISPFQKMYLKSDNRVALYQIELDEIPDRELLNQAFVDVVRRQGLMRSSLQRNFMNKHRWLQHQTPATLALPYIDLSYLSLSAREQVVEALMAAEYEVNFDNENGIMFHVVLIRHQLNQCTLLFNLDHSIFDNMSGQVLRRQLVNRYRALRSGSTASMPPVRSFNEYLNQINAGPLGITPQQLIELFELDKYGETRLAVENHIVANRQPNISQLQYKVRLADLNISDDDEAAFEVTLSLLSYGLARYFNIEHVPMKLIYQGRKYHDLPFFDTLGLFVDVVPLLIDTSGTSAQMIAGMNQKIQSLNRYNVSFMNMVLNLGMLVKWRDVVGLTSPKKLPQKDPMILLNYAGKAGQEYRKIIDFATSQMLDSPGKLDYASFYAIATSDDEHIVLDILCNFEPDMSRFSAVMDDALNTELLNTTPLE